MTPFIEAISISKKFMTSTGDLSVLEDFDCSIDEGEFLFVTGPNGVGKSVFAKCLAGLIQFESGYLKIDGEKHERIDRKTARAIGIEYVPQALPRPESLTAIEFLALGQPREEFLFRRLSIRNAAQKVIDDHSLGFDLNLLDASLALLPLPDLRRLYLVRALMSGARLLILDEPTAGLSEDESHKLLDTLKQLAGSTRTNHGMAGGRSVIEHMGQEASSQQEFGHQLSILVIAHPMQFNKATNSVRHFSKNGLTVGSHTSAMQQFIKIERIPVQSQPRLKRTVSIGSAGSIDLRSGKIITIVGEASQEFDSCFQETRVALREENGLTVREIPFDGIENGLAQDLSVFENCLINLWRHNDRHPIQRYPDKVKETVRGEEELLVESIISNLRIKTSGVDALVSHLSGGNKQRLLIGRELWDKSDLLIAGDIFRGLDDDGIKCVVNLLLGKATDGLCIILFSVIPQFEELFSDEVYQFKAGKLHKKHQS